MRLAVFTIEPEQSQYFMQRTMLMGIIHSFPTEKTLMKSFEKGLTWIHSYPPIAEDKEIVYFCGMADDLCRMGSMSVYLDKGYRVFLVSELNWIPDGDFNPEPYKELFGSDVMVSLATLMTK